MRLGLNSVKYVLLSLGKFLVKPYWQMSVSFRGKNRDPRLVRVDHQGFLAPFLDTSVLLKEIHHHHHLSRGSGS